MPPWLAVDHTEHQWLTRKWSRDLWQQLLCFSHEAFHSPLFSKDLTLLKIQPGCLWISCIIPICSLFISYSEKEPLMSHLRKPMLFAFNHPLLIMLSLHAVGWGGHSSPRWGWLAAPLLFSVFYEIPKSLTWCFSCPIPSVVFPPPAGPHSATVSPATKEFKQWCSQTKTFLL